jgi:hypothetical protein
VRHYIGVRVTGPSSPFTTRLSICWLVHEIAEALQESSTVPVPGGHLASQILRVQPRHSSYSCSSLQSCRYKPGKAPEANDPPGAAARQVLTQRLSQKLLDRLTGMQRSGQLPEKETCDMLILDR